MEDLKEKVIKALGKLVEEDIIKAESVDVLMRLLGTIINVPKRD